MMLIVSVFLAGLCAVVLIMIILTYVDTLSKRLQSTRLPSKQTLAAVVLPGSGISGPSFSTVSPPLGDARIVRSPIPFKDRQILRRCPERVLTATDDLYTEVTMSDNPTAKFRLSKPNPGQCTDPNDVVITSNTANGDTRYLAYNDDNVCEDTTVSMSNYIAKNTSRLQGCFSVEKDSNYPSYARLRASRRGKCNKQHLYADCPGEVKIGNVNVPDASQFEWRLDQM